MHRRGRVLINVSNSHAKAEASSGRWWSAKNRAVRRIASGDPDYDEQTRSRYAGVLMLLVRSLGRFSASI